jgi:hypothetical protein
MGRTIATNEIAIARTAEPGAAVANLRARVGGYVVDMVIFGAISMVMFVIAGAIMLASTDWGVNNLPDPALYGALATVGVGTPVVWTLMNLLLLTTRGQTGGEYVAGVRLVREDGASLSAGNALGWWFLLNPLLFSWPMACVAAIPLAGTIAVALNRATVVIFGVVIVLCVLAPIIALVSALLDGQNRALQDRIIGTIVVPNGG